MVKQLPPTVSAQLKTALNAITKIQELNGDPAEKATAYYRLATYAAGLGETAIRAALPAAGVSGDGPDPPAS